MEVVERHECVAIASSTPVDDTPANKAAVILHGHERGTAGVETLDVCQVADRGIAGATVSTVHAVRKIAAKDCLTPHLDRAIGLQPGPRSPGGVERDEPRLLGVWMVPITPTQLANVRERSPAIDAVILPHCTEGSIASPDRLVRAARRAIRDKRIQMPPPADDVAGACERGE